MIRNFLAIAGVCCFIAVANHFEFFYWSSPSYGLVRREKHSKRTDVCFVTFEFAANGDFLEPIQNLDRMGIRMTADKFRYRYIVFTNDKYLNTEDWEKYVLQLDTTRYTRIKTHVSYSKFLAWKEPITASCRVIFPMDGIYVPVNNTEVWGELERRMQLSPGGLLAQLKPKNKTVVEMVKLLRSMRKDSGEMVRATKKWLLSRPNFDENTLCLWTNFFGYDPTNDLYRNASEDFWSLYSTEMITVRDQPLWSYMVAQWNLQPSYLKAVEPDIEERKPYVHPCEEVRRAECEKHRKPGNETSCSVRFQHHMNLDPITVNCTKKKQHRYTAKLTFASAKQDESKKDEKKNKSGKKKDEKKNKSEKKNDYTIAKSENKNEKTTKSEYKTDHTITKSNNKNEKTTKSDYKTDYTITKSNNKNENITKLGLQKDKSTTESTKNQDKGTAKSINKQDPTAQSKSKKDNTNSTRSTKVEGVHG